MWTIRTVSWKWKTGWKYDPSCTISENEISGRRSCNIQVILSFASILWSLGHWAGLPHCTMPFHSVNGATERCTALAWLMGHLDGNIQQTAGIQRQNFKNDIRVRTANMKIIQNENWSQGLGCRFPWRENRERRGPKIDTQGKPSFGEGRGEKEQIQKTQHVCGSPASSVYTAAGLPPALHHSRHTKAGPCTVTVSVPMCSSQPFLHSLSSLYPHGLPSYLWSHLRPYK